MVVVMRPFVDARPLTEARPLLCARPLEVDLDAPSTESVPASSEDSSLQPTRPARAPSVRERFKVSLNVVRMECDHSQSSNRANDSKSVEAGFAWGLGSGPARRS